MNQASPSTQGSHLLLQAAGQQGQRRHEATEAWVSLVLCLLPVCLPKPLKHAAQQHAAVYPA